MKSIYICLLSILFLYFPINKALAEPSPVQSGNLSLKLEPGVCAPLTQSQARRFGIGMDLTIKALWSITPYLAIGPSITELILPSHYASKQTGTAFTIGPALQLRRSHTMPEGDRYQMLSPWVGVDTMYVHTGGLNRLGYSVETGVSVPIGYQRMFWIGPFVRYFQILQPNEANCDNRDAKLLTLGISLEISGGVEHPKDQVVEPILPPEVQPTPITPEVQPVVIDKLQLDEKIQFAFDKAILLPSSLVVLDKVVQELKDHPDFYIWVNGHASSEGQDGYNQTLSIYRAQAVAVYLTENGINQSRLIVRGFGSTQPIAPNTTRAGREANRRVSFDTQSISKGE